MRICEKHGDIVEYVVHPRFRICSKFKESFLTKDFTPCELIVFEGNKLQQKRHPINQANLTRSNGIYI